MVNHMNKVELSIWIEKNYPISGMGRQRRPLYGVGVNDAEYMTNPMANGVMLWDPAYRAWSNMLQRAYDPKLHERQPTYVGVTVCEDWHSFNAFRTWWLANHRDGFSLDKDLLTPGNREYGPDTCLYVPQWINTFTVDNGASRGEFPIGVCLHKRTGRYRSLCHNPITGKDNELGLFNTPEAAHEAWLNYKLELADQLKQDMDAIDQRIYPNVVTIVKAIS